MIKFYDLFGGIGGFRHGLEQTKGFKCVGYCEWDKHAVKCYNENFNETHEPTDVTKLKADDIPDFDMLVGGFPCQPFSVAGKRKAFDSNRMRTSARFPRQLDGNAFRHAKIQVSGKRGDNQRNSGYRRKDFGGSEK